MTGLLASEVRRLTSRRMARVIAIAVLAFTALVLLRMFTWSTPVPDDVARAAVAQAEESRAQCEEFKRSGQYPEEIPCRAEPQYGGRAVDAVGGLGGATTAAIVVTALAAFVIGSSYVGADWSAGTMQALLFWEPRRDRVLAAKAVALVAVSTAFLAAYWAFLYLGTWFVAATRGVTYGLSSGDHLANLLTLGRGAGLVTFAALAGFAIAGLSRVTAASLGVGFVYFVILEGVVRAFLSKLVKFLLIPNVGAVLTLEGEFDISAARGAVTLAAYAALLLGAFYYSFSRRDVT